MENIIIKLIGSIILIINFQCISGQCVVKKEYQGVCSNDDDCRSDLGLFCQNVTDGCNCPTKSTPNTCDCILVFTYTAFTI